MEVTTESLKADFQSTGMIGELEGHEAGSLMPCLLDEDKAYFLEISQKFDLVMEWAKGLVIVDDTSLAKATDIVAVLKKGDKALEYRSTELRAPLRERNAEILNAFKTIQSKISNTLGILRGQMVRYHDEKERKREAEIREAKRIEEAALKEEQDKAIKEAVRTREQEDVDKVESIATRQDALKAADTTPAKTVSRGRFGISGTRKIPDLEKIQEAVNKRVNIPGIRAWQEWHFEITEPRLLPAEYKKSSLYTR